MNSTNSTEAYKKTFEILGGFYGSQTGLDTVFMRIGNIFGPLYYSGFNLPSRLVKAAVTGQPPQYGSAGTPFAEDEGDWTFVKDVSKGIQLLIMAGKLNKFFAGICLNEQPWIWDDKSSTKTAIQTALGDEAEIVGFIRFQIGE